MDNERNGTLFGPKQEHFSTLENYIIQLCRSYDGGTNATHLLSVHSCSCGILENR